MKINRIHNDEGEFRCFEVDNRIISRSGMSKVISQIPGVQITYFPKFYSIEVFCEFELNGKKFEVAEPYGDSSIYDVVAQEPNLIEMNVIADHFEKSKPIKGGDFGQRVFFLFNWCLTSAFWIGIGCAVIWGYNKIFS